MNFTRQQVSDACRALGQSTNPLPAAIDGSKLLWALALNESTGGTNCTPRHEDAFDVGGKYSSDPTQAALLQRYGRAGACSYGPLQVLLVNAATSNAKGAAPEDFDDCFRAMVLSLKFLNRQLARFKPQTLTEIGELWNHGSETMQGVPVVLKIPGVKRYVDQLTKNYQVPLLPESSI